MMAEKTRQVARIDHRRAPIEAVDSTGPSRSLTTSKGGQLAEIPNPAETIAGGIATAVAAVVGGAIPYAGRGSQDLSFEGDVEHQAVDGSVTKARLNFKYSAR